MTSRPQPQHVIYRILFHQVVTLQARALEAEQSGQDGSKFRNLFKRVAHLTDLELTQLNAIAIDCENEIFLADQKAGEIVKAFRAQLHDKDRSTLPSLPKELYTLQELRNQIIIQARERLRNAFGDNEFRRFDGYVQRTLGSKAHAVAPDHLKLVKRR